MGGMDCFKREGQGILLLDNGGCVVGNYRLDGMVGHSVVFRDRALTSLLVGRDRGRTVCYRTGPYLLSVGVNARDVADGLGLFLNYKTAKIYKIRFRNGELVVKQRLAHP